MEADSSTDTLIALFADAITCHHNPEDHSIQVLATRLPLPDDTVPSQLFLSRCPYCLHPVVAGEILLSRSIGYSAKQFFSIIYRYNNYNNVENQNKETIF
jgi:hypothetical protein